MTLRLRASLVLRKEEESSGACTLHSPGGVLLEENFCCAQQRRRMAMATTPCQMCKDGRREGQSGDSCGRSSIGVEKAEWRWFSPQESDQCVTPIGRREGATQVAEFSAARRAIWVVPFSRLWAIFISTVGDFCSKFRAPHRRNDPRSQTRTDLLSCRKRQSFLSCSQIRQSCQTYEGHVGVSTEVVAFHSQWNCIWSFRSYEGVSCFL